MKRIKEEEFDNLFKHQLKEADFDPGYLEDDWDRLELMLDKPRKRRGIVIWLPVLSSAAAILLFLGWWMLRPEVAAVVKPQHGQIVKNSTGQSTNSTTQPAGSNASPTASAGQQYSVSSQNQTTKSNNVARSFPQTKTTTGLAPDNHHHTAPNANSLSAPHQTNGVIGSKPSDQIIDKSKDPASANPGQFAVNRNPNELFTGNAQLGLNDGNKNTLTAKVEAKQIIVDLPYRLPTEEENKKADEKSGSPVFAKHKQLTLTVLGAPEVNGVGSFGDAKAGTNVGLLFSAGVFNKLTVSTGATYATMPYNTNIANYHTNYAFKTNPSAIEADCRALDIPINVDYQLYNKGLNKFSVGTGLSSYIMLHESYDYYYNDPAAKGPAAYTVANHGKYLFGIANIQATYTRQVNAKFGISVQPYLKLPLTNIGYSQAKLQTAGVAVGLSWNINSLTKP
jgi:cytoskeletal protein RodZ